MMISGVQGMIWTSGPGIIEIEQHTSLYPQVSE